MSQVLVNYLHKVLFQWLQQKQIGVGSFLCIDILRCVTSVRTIAEKSISGFSQGHTHILPPGLLLSQTHTDLETGILASAFMTRKTSQSMCHSVVWKH